MTHFLAGVIVGAIATIAAYLYLVFRPVRVEWDATPWGDV